MPIEFAWHDDETRWNRRSAPETPQRNWKRLLSILGVLVLLAGTVFGAVRWASERGLERAKADVMNVMVLEAQALSRGDGELLSRFQDSSDKQWVDLQTAWAKTRPVLSNLKIQDLILQNDRAWVEVSWKEGTQDFQSVEFYRRVNGQWLHTRPDPAYWGKQIHQQFGSLNFVYTDRDAALVEKWRLELADVAGNACASLKCGTLNPPTTIELQPDYLDPTFDGEVVRLSSPRLRNLGGDGEPTIAWKTQASIALLRMVVARTTPDLGTSDVANHVRTGMAVWEARREGLATSFGSDQVAGDDLQQISERFGNNGLDQMLAGLRYSTKPGTSPQPSDWRPYFQMLLLSEAQQVNQNLLTPFSNLQGPGRFFGYNNRGAHVAALSDGGTIQVDQVSLQGSNALVDLTYSWGGMSYREVQPFSLDKGAWGHTQPGPRDWGRTHREVANGITLIYQQKDAWWAAGLAPVIRQELTAAQQRLGLNPSTRPLTITVASPYALGSAFGNRDGSNLLVISPLLTQGVNIQPDQTAMARYLLQRALLSQRNGSLLGGQSNYLYGASVVNWALKIDADDPLVRKLRLREAKAALDNNTFLSVSEMFTFNNGSNGSNSGRNNDPQGIRQTRNVETPLFIEYVASRWGDQKVLDLLHAPGDNLDDWLFTTLQVHTATFDNDWRQWVRAQAQAAG